MNKDLCSALLIYHRSSVLRPPDRNVPTKDHILWSSCYDCHQGTNWNAADKQRRKNAKVTNT